MAPTVFEKAEKDRDAVVSQLEFLERRMKDHDTTPMNEHRADQYITTISSIKHEVLDANKRMESSAPTGTDMKAIKTTFFDLLYRIEEVDGKLYDIKSAFPAPSAASTTTTHATPPVSYTHLRAHETVLDLVC